MPVSVPVPDKAAGDIFTEAMWDSYLRDNINKLLSRGHRTLTVAQFAALGVDVEDGDEVYLEVDASAGVLWHLVYEASETTYKWRFLGGPPMFNEVPTGEIPGSPDSTYVALTTAGPSVALPRSGDYDVDTGAHMTRQDNSMSYDIGATGAVDADAIGGIVGAAAAGFSRTRRKTAVAAVTLTSKYKNNGAGNGATISKRYMKVTPVRIRHDA